MFQKIAVIAFALVAIVASASKVVELNANNFDEIVLDGTKNVFVKFYAPWCGHCVRMAPAWDEVADKVNEDTIIANLDATAHQAVAQRFGVRGFPTLKFFTKGNKDGMAYQGGRDTASLTAFVEKNAQ